MPSKPKKVPVAGITKAILMMLGVGAVIGVALAFPGLGIIYREYKKKQWEAARNRGILRATIKRLERQELISWSEKNGKLRLTLTDKGKKKVLQYNIDVLKVDDTKRWDRLWRVITFDIPEEKKVAREMFRKKLMSLGLHRLQRSVFVCRFECKAEVTFLAHALEVADHVQYILAKEIPGLK